MSYRKEKPQSHNPNPQCRLNCLCKAHLGPSVTGRSGLQKEARVFSHVAVHHCLPQSYIPKDLMSAKYLFICHDAYRTPLQSLYDGPFHVLEAGPKYFLIEIGTGQDRVSVDRLKPAHVLQDDAVELARPARRGRPPNPIPDVGFLTLPVPRSPPKSNRHSRRGREVRLPQRYT